MAYIDKKVTIWERYEIPEDIELIDFSDEDDVNGFIHEHFLCSELLLETDYPLTVEENGGASTVEVYDDFGELIYNN